MKLFTIDYEDWFSPRNIPGFAELKWDQCELFLEKPTEILLKLLDQKKIKAIFFILGYIAERAPELIMKIAERGHEIASHGYSHRLIYTMTPEEFKQDLEKSINILNQLGFNKINGFRAPSFSITEKSIWAIDILKECGIKYSSSIYPTNLHTEYGIKNCKNKIFYHQNGILEIPMNSKKIMNLQLPCSGGAYFRFYNYKLFRKLAKQSYKEAGHYIFYIHPWELSPEHPRIKTDFLSKVRHYHNIEKVEAKLNKLLDDIKFDSCSILSNQY